MLARGLSPVQMEANGLMSALQELATNTSDLFRVQCRFQSKEPVLIHDSTASTHLYRIVQEAISNAIRHGKAKKINIELSSGHDRSLLQIESDGQPFRKKIDQSSGMGLRIMQYRAGMMNAHLEMQPGEKGGTVVRCAFPKSL
jgi:two-component system CheB/CheR fusion protein